MTHEMKWTCEKWGEVDSMKVRDIKMHGATCGLDNTTGSNSLAAMNVHVLHLYPHVDGTYGTPFLYKNLPYETLTQLLGGASLAFSKFYTDAEFVCLWYLPFPHSYQCIH